LDAARDEVIYGKLVTSDIEKACLYQGKQAIELADVAPHLVRLWQGDSFTKWLLNNGWGNSWGIFLESSATLNELRQHFRKFTIVQDEEGTPLYFRYYDPRVLRNYLPTCNKDELQILFGPVSHYYVEGEDSNSMINYSFDEGRLTQNVVQVTTSPNSLA